MIQIRENQIVCNWNVLAVIYAALPLSFFMSKEIGAFYILALTIIAYFGPLVVPKSGDVENDESNGINLRGKEGET